MTTPNDPTISHDSLDAVIAAYMLAVEAGDVPNCQELLDQHLEHAEALQAFFADLDRMDRVASPLRLADGLDATHAVEAATPNCRPTATSAITSCWRRSPEAGWGWCTRRGRCRSTGSSRSR
ncbi:MAG: hypothetical protein WBX00_09985 [Isosphaeraceae bacterium]